MICQGIERRVTQCVMMALLLPALPLRAAVNFSAEVDRNVISIGERFTYTITLQGEGMGADIIPPDFEGFNVVMGPSSSSSIQMINGRVSQSQTVSYVLRALKPGTVTIGAAKVKVKRAFYNTEPITIEVQSGGGAPPQVTPNRQPTRRSEQPDIGSDTPEVFLTAHADKDTVYKLDMVAVSYRLYLRVNVSNYNFVKMPQATGFWQEEFQMPDRPVLQDVEVRGVPYKMAEIRKIVLFPTRTGALELEPLVVDVAIERPVSQRRRSGDPFDWFFDDPFYRTQHSDKTVQTEPLHLTVLDLPREGQSALANFHGDVGDYRLNVDYDKRDLTQNDALTVKVVISGQGYLKSVDAPKLSLPPGFEQFAPTADESVTMTGGRMQGRKSFTYVVIPRRAGRFELEPVAFSFFNPRSGAYETVRSGGMALNVNPSEGGESGIAAGPGPSEVTLMGSDIRFIHGLSGELEPIGAPIYQSGWFYGLLFTSPLLYLLGLGVEGVMERRMADRAGVRRRKALDGMRRALTTADKSLKRSGDMANVLAGLGQELSEFVGAVIKEPTAGLTGDLITAKLYDAGAEPEFIDELRALLGMADAVKFGGGRVDAAQAGALLERFRAAAEKLGKLG
jgi:hypothetical protein